MRCRRTHTSAPSSCSCCTSSGTSVFRLLYSMIRCVCGLVIPCLHGRCDPLLCRVLHRGRWQWRPCVMSAMGCCMAVDSRMLAECLTDSGSPSRAQRCPTSMACNSPAASSTLVWVQVLSELVEVVQCSTDREAINMGIWLHETLSLMARWRVRPSQQRHSVTKLETTSIVSITA